MRTREKTKIVPFLPPYWWADNIVSITGKGYAGDIKEIRSEGMNRTFDDLPDPDWFENEVITILKKELPKSLRRYFH
jgi:hypothetical protein